MPLYSYKAVDYSGKSVTGSMSGRDEAEIKSKIQENGLVAVRIKKGSELNEKLKNLTAGKIDIKVVALFCRQLHIILSSGINILNGLDVLRNQTRNKKFKKLVEKLYNDVCKGRSLSEGMGDNEAGLPVLLVNMISVGEISGNLDQILKQMAVYYEKESYIKDKLKSAMIYPVILVCAAIGMLAFFINFVLPEITGMLVESGAKLPGITRAVVGSVDFLKNYFLVILGAAVVLVFIVQASVPKQVRKMAKDRLLMKIPLVNVNLRNVVTSRFMRTVSMMLKGGIPLIQVLESTEKVVGNAIAEAGVNTAIDGIRRGERLGDNIATCGFFDPMVTHMINIGEETGQLDNILETMADFYDKEAETGLMKMMAMVEPIFTIVIGIFIAILIISMMLPMFNMLSQIKQ